jgi:hypothetical protein
VSALRRVGRPPQCPGDVRDLVIELHEEGLSLQKIADRLNASGCPTPSGKTSWSRQTVYGLLGRRHVRELIDA